MFPSNNPFGENEPNVEAEFHAFLDKEELFGMQMGEMDLQEVAVENAFMKKLVDSGFPLAEELMEAHAKVHAAKLDDKTGLAATYDFLITRRDQLESDAESDSPFAMVSKIAYRMMDEMSNLAGAVQLLAAAKCYQDELFRQAQYAEDNDNPSLAESFREAAYEARKEAEAQLLTDERFDMETSSGILLAVSSDFEGKSILPIDDESRSYMIMYRLKQEKFYDEAEETRAYSQAARSILESNLTVGQTQHPEFQAFAFSLCRAASNSVLEPRRTSGLEQEQVESYQMLIEANLSVARKIAPELGIEPWTLQTLLESIITELQ